jgi:hypothetical protein
VLNKLAERVMDAPAAPRLKVVDTDKGVKISLDHPDAGVAYGLLMEALGTADLAFAQGLLHELVTAAAHEGNARERDINFMVSVIKGVRPNDHIEAILAAQMVSVHMATMKFSAHYFPR